MQSIFELKEKITFDLTVFDQMKQKAEELLSNIDKSKYTQVIVLLSAKENEYSIVVRDALSKQNVDENLLLFKLQEAKDSEICFVLCMWQDSCIDVPSFNFRKLLLGLNEKNSETTMFVETADGISGVKLLSTMK